MLTDLEICGLLQQQYDNVPGVFNISARYGVVSWALKKYDDCSALLFEGSYCLPDWVSNFEGLMVQSAVGGVERGFHDGLDDVLRAVLPVLPRELPVYVAGHSRGAGHAHIFAAMLVQAGYAVTVVTFGSPLPGDAKLKAILTGCPQRSYWNYHDSFHHDPVGDVPLALGDFEPYVMPCERTLINVSPAPGDSWGIFARHHLFLYRKGLEAVHG